MVAKLAAKLQTAWSMIGITLVMLLFADSCLQSSLRKREHGQFRAYMDVYPDLDKSWVQDYTT